MSTLTAQSLFNAYREGLLNKNRPPSRDYHPQFRVLLRQLLLNQVPLMERARVRKVWKTCERALCLARVGKVDEASAIIGLGESTIEQLSPNSVGELMSRSVLDSAQAYIDFKNCRFDQAREKLWAAMDSDLALEQDEAFGLLEIHRIQSAQNLMRLELRGDRHEWACLLGGSILGYLEDLTSSLPVHRSWQRIALMRSPRAIRRAMITQVGNEISPALLMNPSIMGWSRFCEGLGTNSDYLQGGEALHVGVQQWVRIKNAFKLKEWASYSTLLEIFFREGKRDILPIWYSAAIEFIDFCQVMDSRAFLQARAGILRDSVRWPSVPPMLRLCLNKRMES